LQRAGYDRRRSDCASDTIETWLIIRVWADCRWHGHSWSCLIDPFVIDALCITDYYDRIIVALRSQFLHLSQSKHIFLSARVAEIKKNLHSLDLICLL